MSRQAINIAAANALLVRPYVVKDGLDSLERPLPQRLSVTIELSHSSNGYPLNYLLRQGLLA